MLAGAAWEEPAQTRAKLMTIAKLRRLGQDAEDAVHDALVAMLVMDRGRLLRAALIVRRKYVLGSGRARLPQPEALCHYQVSKAAWTTSSATEARRELNQLPLSWRLRRFMDGHGYVLAGESRQLAHKRFWAEVGEMGGCSRKG